MVSLALAMEAILCKRAMELENWTENQRREETSIK
jgi:hypothetical protein